MSVGVGITCGGDLWEPDQIRAVEALGFDSFWTGEHIIYHRPILEAMIGMAGCFEIKSSMSVSSR